MLALQILIWTFLVLLFAGLIVYIVYFVLNKVLLNRLIKLMKRYNKLANDIHSINFFKIENLINHNLPIKIDLPDLKRRYGIITVNAQYIYSNLSSIYIELNVMNLKSSSDHIKIMDKKIALNEKYVLDIKNECAKCTEYGDAIDNIAQSYSDIFETLKEFYWKNVKLAKDFKPINELLDTISHTIAKLPNYAEKYDFKKTNNVIFDLRKKMQIFVKALDGVLKLQIVSEFLTKSVNNSDRVINNVFRTIETQDLQMVNKLFASYKNSVQNFKAAYTQLDLAAAKTALLTCAEISHQINNFIHIHTETQSLIELSLVEIEKQTNTILTNKDKIFKSLDGIAKYFFKDEIITKSFEKVKSDIELIEKLASTCKVITSKTYNQKIDAIKQIAALSKNIYSKKESVKATIEEVNDILSDVIEITTNINDLYIYFWQILSFAKTIAKDDKTTNDMESLIKNNFKLLNSYIQEIVSNVHPDYHEINNNLKNMMQNIDQFANKLKTDATLKSYAAKLTVYANRYKGLASNTAAFEEANKLYNAKKYDECINALLKIIKTSKKSHKVNE